MLWSNLDDWQDAKQDIQAQVQGPPTYYNNPSTSEPHRPNYQDHSPLPPVRLASIITQEDPTRAKFREKLARREKQEREKQEKQEREKQEHEDRRTKRHAAYLKQVEVSQKDVAKKVFQEEFALRVERRPPGRPPGRPPKPPQAPDPELEEMSKMYERRIKATLKRRARIMMKGRRTKADVRAEYDARLANA